MTIAQLKDFNLNPAFGYKVKTHRGSVDLCFFRYDRKQSAWKEELTGGIYRSDVEVKSVLAEHMERGEFVIFDCCCQDCLTPEKRAITEDFTKKTGLFVSHGYNPECFKKMERIYAKDL